LNFGLKRQRDVEVNLTPLIDVVFLLLIFFMVSTTFISESSIDISLPVSATADTTIDVNKNIELSLKSDGTVFIGERSLGAFNPEKIESVLSAVAQKAESPIIVISADSDISHQTVISVMDAARKAKLFRVTFKTRDNDSNVK